MIASHHHKHRGHGMFVVTAYYDGLAVIGAHACKVDSILKPCVNHLRRTI